MRALYKHREYINLLRERQEIEKLSSPGKRSKSPKHLFIDLVEKFLNSLKLHAKRSEATVSSITSSLASFAEYMLHEQQIDIKSFFVAECTASRIRQWLEYELDVRGNSIRTRNLKLAHIRHFMRYVCDENFTLQYGDILSGIYKIPVLRPVQKEKECLSKEQFIAIEKVARSMNKGYRNCVMLLLLYETAIRANELISLRVKSIDLRESNPTVLIEGKNKKNRAVPLNNETADIMRRYMNNMHLNSDKDDPLFYSYKKCKKEPLTTRMLRYIIVECGKTARIEDPTIPEIVHPHMFRRSRATSLYQNNTPIELIASMLGHSNSDTTAKYYAKPSNEQIRDIMKKSSLNDGWSETPDLDAPEVKNALKVLKQARTKAKSKKSKKDAEN